MKEFTVYNTNGKIIRRGQVSAGEAVDGVKPEIDLALQVQGADEFVCEGSYSPIEYHFVDHVPVLKPVVGEASTGISEHKSILRASVNSKATNAMGRSTPIDLIHNAKRQEALVVVVDENATPDAYPYLKIDCDLLGISVQEAAQIVLNKAFLDDMARLGIEALRRSLLDELEAITDQPGLDAFALKITPISFSELQ